MGQGAEKRSRRLGASAETTGTLVTLVPPADRDQRFRTWAIVCPQICDFSPCGAWLGSGWPWIFQGICGPAGGRGGPSAAARVLQLLGARQHGARREMNHWWRCRSHVQGARDCACARDGQQSETARWKMDGVLSRLRRWAVGHKGTSYPPPPCSLSSPCKTAPPIRLLNIFAQLGCLVGGPHPPPIPNPCPPPPLPTAPLAVPELWRKPTKWLARLTHNEDTSGTSPAAVRTLPQVFCPSAANRSPRSRPVFGIGYGKDGGTGWRCFLGTEQVDACAACVFF